MLALLALYGDCESIAFANSHVRQERFVINKKAEGLVVTFGTGANGELGKN